MLPHKIQLLFLNSSGRDLYIPRQGLIVVNVVVVEVTRSRTTDLPVRPADVSPAGTASCVLITFHIQAHSLQVEELLAHLQKLPRKLSTAWYIARDYRLQYFSFHWLHLPISVGQPDHNVESASNIQRLVCHGCLESTSKLSFLSPHMYAWLPGYEMELW